MANVAADGNTQRAGLDAMLTQSQCVQQSLGGMGMAAVARIEYARTRTQMLRYELWRAGFLVTHDESVAMHRLKRVHGVEQGFALGRRRTGDIEIDHVRAEALRRQ